MISCGMRDPAETKLRMSNMKKNRVKNSAVWLNIAVTGEEKKNQQFAIVVKLFCMINYICRKGKHN